MYIDQQKHTFKLIISRKQAIGLVIGIATVILLKLDFTPSIPITIASKVSYLAMLITILFVIYKKIKEGLSIFIIFPLFAMAVFSILMLLNLLNIALTIVVLSYALLYVIYELIKPAKRSV